MAGRGEAEMSDHQQPSLLRERTGTQRVTNIELFFDLVYVFAVTQLSGHRNWAWPRAPRRWSSPSPSPTTCRGEPGDEPPRSSLVDYLREGDRAAVPGLVHGAHAELHVVFRDIERDRGDVADVE